MTAPLVVPSGANSKTYEHKIYANEEGLRLLIDLCHQCLSSGEVAKGQIEQSGETIKLEIIPTTQEGFDCRDNLLEKLLKRDGL